MSQPGLRERKKLRTRWAIQAHALRLVAEQGYDQTTVDQIAAAAEISPSTFFRYFKTKEDVILDDEYDPIMVSAIDAAPAELSPLEAIRHAIVGALGSLTPAAEAKLAERSTLILSVPALRARVYESFGGQLELVAGPVARRLGREPGDVEVRVICGAVVGAMLAAVFDWAERGAKERLGTTLVRAIDVLADGMPVRSPRP